MREIPLSPELVGVRGGRVVRTGRGEGGVLIRVRASLREAHPVVQAGRPERLERQIVSAHGGTAGALAATRPRPVFPPVPGGGKHSLGTLKDAAHARAASTVPDATTLLLRLRPPGTRALQATYRDRAFDLVPGLEPPFFFFSGGADDPPGGRFLSRLPLSLSPPAGPAGPAGPKEPFKAGPSSLSRLFYASANVLPAPDRWS